MSPAPAGSAGERRGWGWVAHLCAGGTTPWADWVAEGEPRGRVLPGAQQLELLRRLNVAASSAGRADRPDADLVRRVLEASAPGRGRPDLELVGAVDPGRFGPRPVDPADLPDDELVRVATSVLADRLVEDGVPGPAERGRSVAPAPPWRRRHRLVGDPWLAEPARDALVARGRPPGGRGAVVLVLATDLATMLTDAWRHRVTTEGGPPWRDWLAATVARDRVPPRVDVHRAARTWVERVGPERVRLVLDQAALPRLAGTRRPLPGPPALSADGAELARRTAPVLGLLVLPERRTALLRQRLVPRLVAAGGAPLVVPPEHAAWTRRTAERLREEVRSAGYAVVGDPDALLPAPPAPGQHSGATEPSEPGVLRIAVRLLLEDHTDRRTEER